MSKTKGRPSSLNSKASLAEAVTGSLLERMSSAPQLNDRGWLEFFFCPFHNDQQHPNLGIHEDRQRFNCVGCGSRGPLYELAWKLEAGIEAVYHFDGGGKIVRFRDKTLRPHQSDGNGGVVWNWHGLPRYLYRVNDALEGDANRWVFLVEGMKDVDTAFEKLSVRATCNPFGAAERWRPEYSEPLRGRKVCIVVDPDDAGERWCQTAIRALTGKARQIRVLRLGADLTDWVEQGGSRDKLVKLLTEAKPVSFVPTYKGSTSAETNLWMPQPITKAESEATAPEWVWGMGEKGFLARGEVTDLYGLWKSGKSTLIAALLASRGKTLAGEPVTAVPTLLITEESARRWAGRANDLSISPDEVHRISRPFKKRPEWGEWEEFVVHVAGLIKERDYGLVVVDALPNLWPVVKENDAGEVLRALQPLQTWAESGAAVLLVRHPRKSDGSEATAGRGSGAIGGFVDIICEFRRYRPEDDKDKRRILTVYSREEPFEIVVEWMGGTEYEEIGSKAEVGRRERVEAVRALLLGHPHLTEDEALKLWDSSEIPERLLSSLTLTVHIS